MRDWKDFNGDGEINYTENLFAEEMLCTSREEHIALFGNAGDYDDEDYDDEDYDDEDYDDEDYDDDEDYF